VLQTVDQKGSLVAPDRMRFDFTSKQALRVDQVKEAEQAAQKLIDTQEKVCSRECTLAEAREINGLRAVFDEGKISDISPNSYMNNQFITNFMKHTLTLFVWFPLEFQLKHC
jgi:alanyl-tRNA synthetase